MHFRCPVIKHLSTLNFTAPGRIKKIRGIATSTRVSPQMANRLIDSARSILGVTSRTSTSCRRLPR